MKNAAERADCQGEQENVEQNSQVSKPAYWFPVYEGLFEHAQTIRDAVWFFIWIIARTTVERDGEGRVLGGIPIDDGRPAREIGVSVKVIRRWRRILLKGGYILAVRTGSGFKYTLLKSKKYQYRDRPNRPISKQNQTGTQGREVPERADQIGRVAPIRSAGAGSSNKKIQGQHKEDERGGGAQTAAAPNPVVPVLKDCWEILGLTMPIGAVAFQGEWEAFYDKHPDADVHLVDVMEEFIQLKQTRGQKGIPPKFYELKHEQERLHKEMIQEIDEAKRWAEANQRFEEDLQERLALEATSSQVILLPAETPALPERAGQTERLTERQTLGLVLLEPAALEKHPKISKLDAENFNDVRHQVIFYGMKYLRRNGPALTLDTLIGLLQSRGELERAGGEEYIRSLVDAEPAREATA